MVGRRSWTQAKHTIREERRGPPSPLGLDVPGSETASATCPYFQDTPGLGAILAWLAHYHTVFYSDLSPSLAKAQEAGDDA